MSQRTPGAPVPWRWNPRKRAFELPRPLRLPKRQRGIARRQVRTQADKRQT